MQAFISYKVLKFRRRRLAWFKMAQSSHLQHFLFIFILVLFLQPWGCKDFPKSLALRGTGLSEQGDTLIWSLTVGVLQDSGNEEWTLSRLYPALSQARQKVKRLLPGLKIHHVIDQPLNAVFMMERSIAKVAYAPRPGAMKSVLALGPSSYAREQNIEKYRRHGLSPQAIQTELHLLQALQQKKTVKGHFVVSEKMTASDRIWRQYLQGQVRYDLVLSNAFVYADDLQQRKEMVLDQRNFIRWRLTKMAGRLGMEGYGAYVSYATLAKNFEIEMLTQAIYGSLLALVLPVNVETLSSSTKILQFENDFQKSSIWKKYWQQRLRYLRSIARLHRGQVQACTLLARALKMSQAFYHSAKLKGSRSKHGHGHYQVLVANSKNYLHHCKRKLF